MIRRAFVGTGYWLTVACLSVAILAVTAYLLAAFVLPEMERNRVVALPPAPSLSPTSSAPIVRMPIGVPVAADSDCAACHLTGPGQVGTRPIPVMAHPVEGWNDCTACHADERLVETAPGHTGIHREECLVCHQVRQASESAAPRPHHIFSDMACTACHGNSAPLPTDMVGRTNCWICHSGKEAEGLFGPPVPSASPPPPSFPARES